MRKLIDPCGTLTIGMWLLVTFALILWALGMQILRNAVLHRGPDAATGHAVTPLLWPGLFLIFG